MRRAERHRSDTFANQSCAHNEAATTAAARDTVSHGGAFRSRATLAHINQAADAPVHRTGFVYHSLSTGTPLAAAVPRRARVSAEEPPRDVPPPGPVEPSVSLPSPPSFSSSEAPPVDMVVPRRRLLVVAGVIPSPPLPMEDLDPNMLDSRPRAVDLVGDAAVSPPSESPLVAVPAPLALVMRRVRRRLPDWGAGAVQPRGP
jgi:hypothetical protein